MRKIACLGWGSLVWNPGTLPVPANNSWSLNGPLVRVEFLRQSNDGRMTLVLHASAREVRSLWATLAIQSLDAAKLALAKREETKVVNVGCWSSGAALPQPLIPDLDKWAESVGVDAVIWTALPPKFVGIETGEIADADMAIAYLQGLSVEQKALAENYVRKAPTQITTKYRSRIEMELGWKGVKE